MKKQKSMQWLGILIWGLMGAAAGMTYARARTWGEDISIFLEMFLSLFVCIYAQVLVHEAGHLVFGLLSGYRFRSFRVGSVIWIRTDKGVERRRLRLAGTAGQCLMSPPEGDEKKISCCWYLMGGVLMSLLSVLVALALYYAFRSREVLAWFLRMWMIIGAATVLINGIPLRLMEGDNDGRRAWAVCASREAKRAFLAQMRVNDFLSEGGRIRDVSAEALPEENDLSNPMTAALAVFHANRLLDAHRFDEARAEIDRLLSADSAIVGVYLQLLACDRMYLAALDGETERLSELRTPARQRFFKQMRINPSVLRTGYACALLADKDSAKAAAYLARFEDVAKRYPYAGEIEGERELVALAKEKGAQSNG